MRPQAQNVWVTSAGRMSPVSLCGRGQDDFVPQTDRPFRTCLLTVTTIAAVCDTDDQGTSVVHFDRSSGAVSHAHATAGAAGQIDCR